MFASEPKPKRQKINPRNSRKRKKSKDSSSVSELKPSAAIRERERLRIFNDSLEALQKVIPICLPEGRKLHKKQTLQLACRYIQFLRDCLEGKREWEERRRFWCGSDETLHMIDAIDAAATATCHQKRGKSRKRATSPPRANEVVSLPSIYTTTHENQSKGCNENVTAPNSGCNTDVTPSKSVNVKSEHGLNHNKTKNNSFDRNVTIVNSSYDTNVTNSSFDTNETNMSSSFDTNVPNMSSSFDKNVPNMSSSFNHFMKMTTGITRIPFPVNKAYYSIATPATATEPTWPSIASVKSEAENVTESHLVEAIRISRGLLESGQISHDTSSREQKPQIGHNLDEVWSDIDEIIAKNE